MNKIACSQVLIKKKGPYFWSVLCLKCFFFLLRGGGSICFIVVLLLLFSPPIVSNSLRPHGRQHARPPCPSPSSRSSPKFMFIPSVMPSSPLILWHPLLLPSTVPSIRDFSNESSVCIRWPKHRNFSFIISLSSVFQWIVKVDLLWDWLVLSPCCPRDM